MKEFAYTVTGSGRFPVDMLRYDWARPSQSVDSRKIEALLTGVGREGEADLVISVNIVGLNKPTVARWASFGWIVGDVTSRKGTA